MTDLAADRPFRHGLFRQKPRPADWLVLTAIMRVLERAVGRWQRVGT